MAWLADVKVNQSQLVVNRRENVELLREYAALLIHSKLNTPDFEHPLLVADRARNYFPSGVAQDIISILGEVEDRFTGGLRELARLAVAAAVVPSSNMLRRTDLRRRRSGERPPVGLRETIAENLRMMADDVQAEARNITGKAVFVGHDAKGKYAPHTPYDLVITSPPYLNGTNYGRNTKLELLALGFLPNEAGLEGLRKREITAGINNVAKRNAVPRTIPSVELVADRVAEKTYDKRIPAMIRAYFSEMETVFQRTAEESVEGAEFWMDIGDSRYSGISVPTHELLSEVAEGAGWVVHGEEVIRQRRSYDGSVLVQALIKMKKA